MDPDDELRIRANTELIVRNVFVDEVICYLISTFTLNDDMVQEIKHETTDSKKMMKLLSILPKRGPHAYAWFCQALSQQECHRHVVDSLNNTNLDEARRLQATAEYISAGTSGADVDNMAVKHRPSSSVCDQYETEATDMVSCSGGTTWFIERPTLENSTMDLSKKERKKSTMLDCAEPSILGPTDTSTIEGQNVMAGNTSCHEDERPVVSETRCPQLNYMEKRRSTTIIPAVNSWDDCGLLSPTGVAYCSNTNTILVADCIGKRIMWYDMGGNIGRRFVRRGDTSCGEFVPWDVATSRQSGFVFVTDKKNPRVLVFSQSGDYVTSIGSRGTGDAQFLFLFGITCHNGCVLVCDEGNRRVSMVTEDGSHIRHIVSGLYNPRYVAVGPGDTIYVTNYIYTGGQFHGHVRVYRWDGTPVRQFGEHEGAGSKPGGVTVDHKGYVCVAWLNYHRVDVYNPKGELLNSFGRPGRGPRELFHYMFGRLIDALLRNVFFSKAGALSRVMFGRTVDALRYPYGLELLPDGGIVVCDSDHFRLVIF